MDDRAIDETPIGDLTVVEVEPAKHERGRVWWWRQTVLDARAACPRCRPQVPCMAHDAPIVRCVGGPSLDVRLTPCPCQKGNPWLYSGPGSSPSEARFGEATYFDGRNWMTVCEPCALAWLRGEV